MNAALRLTKASAGAAQSTYPGTAFDIERIKPGYPQQNGRHERMHLTLKKEATRPPGANSLAQQARFDAFVREFIRSARDCHPCLR